MSVPSFRRKRFFPVLLLFLASVLSFCITYLNDYYHADIQAVSAFSVSSPLSTVRMDARTTVYQPETPRAGFIFYPGGKVEHTAYEPLMKACAEQGILCVLIEMPFHLAVFDVHAADGIQARFPEIKAWYIGGHSLGGSMAAAHLSENSSSYDGLILLGSYSTEDLSETALKVLSIYGSKDKILNREAYKENYRNLPDSTVEIVIDGGCHAYFGMYGPQEGDGTASISPQSQIEQTARAISDLIGQ